LGLVVAIMVTFALWLRFSAEPAPELSGERTSRTYGLTGFDGVDVSGQWDITIERADSWRVVVDVPVELIDEVGAELRGDQLSISLEGGWCAGCFGGGLELKATITMPALESIDVSGTSRVRFSGFDGPSLSIDWSGAGEVRGTASRYDKLSLDMSGAVSVELGDVPVRDADVDVSGAGNVTLLMAGGRLTGDLSGAANLEYSGTVSEESVDKSGMVNVRRRD
jgi:hypothetical protein